MICTSKFDDRTLRLWSNHIWFWNLPSDLSFRFSYRNRLLSYRSNCWRLLISFTRPRCVCNSAAGSGSQSLVQSLNFEVWFWRFLALTLAKRHCFPFPGCVALTSLKFHQLLIIFNDCNLTIDPGEQTSDFIVGLSSFSISELSRWLVVVENCFEFVSPIHSRTNNLARFFVFLIFLIFSSLLYFGIKPTMLTGKELSDF